MKESLNEKKYIKRIVKFYVEFTTAYIWYWECAQWDQNSSSRDFSSSFSDVTGLQN